MRGINVGGRKKIKMAELRGLYSLLGLRDPRTILQSGNAIFKTDETDLALLQARIEAGIRDQFGFDARVILRGAADFRAIFDRHPFTEEQGSELKKMIVVFLTGCPSLAEVEQLRASNPGREFIQADGSEIFIFYTDGQARSKLDNNRIERALGLAATTRNWNTCQRLLKLLEETEP